MRRPIVARDLLLTPPSTTLPYREHRSWAGREERRDDDPALPVLTGTWSSNPQANWRAHMGSKPRLAAETSKTTLALAMIWLRTCWKRSQTVRNGWALTPVIQAILIKAVCCHFAVTARHPRTFNAIGDQQRRAESPRRGLREGAAGAPVDCWPSQGAIGEH